MSLKVFHLFFVSISVLLAIGVGTIGLRAYFANGSVSQLVWSLLSFAAAAALFVYGVHIRGKLSKLALGLVAASLLHQPTVAYACSVCYGDPTEIQTQAMKMAILFMLVVIVAILSLFAAFFLHLRMRASRYSNQTSQIMDSNGYVEVNAHD